MRTTLFLSTLFAVTLAGGAALADKPTDRIFEGRHHGDQIEKTYTQHETVAQDRSSERTSRQASQRQDTTMKEHLGLTGQSRINCSGDVSDCGASSSARSTSKSSHTGKVALKQGGSFAMQKYGQKSDGGGEYASDTCAEADQCEMSTKTANAIWASGRGGASSAHANTLLTTRPGSASRALAQRLAVPASPEDVQDTPSSDASKKIWSYESVKHGTFTGPSPDLDISSQMHRAAARIAEMKGTRLTKPEKGDKAQTPNDKQSKDAESDER